MKATDLLQWEFEYIRVTASEAMRDRHTMINFYLLAVGIVASSVVSLLKKDSGAPTGTGTALLWGLSVVGILYFLKVIRLRQAWHESATAMNQIKDIYVDGVSEDKQEILKKALKWRSDTLPGLDKRWTVFHLSAMLIGFLTSAALVVGYVLVRLEPVPNGSGALPIPMEEWLIIAIVGLVVLWLHDLAYSRLLKPSGG